MKTQRRNVIGLVGAFFIVTAMTTWAFRNTLFVSIDIYPWGSDTWGHLFKALYVYQQIGQDHWYPDLLPAWYLGTEMLRYYAPLPYYLLAVLYAGLGNIFTAGNLFLFLTAWLGAASMLLFRRWIGLNLATVAGALYAWLPDQLRVAFAEGNLPRALASALLPLALYFLLSILLEPTPSKPSTPPWRAIFGLAMVLALVVISHAMMGAIFAVCLTLVSMLALILSSVNARQFSAAMLGIVSGLGLSAVWLLPSLTGGITEIDTSALSEATARYAPTFSLNPAMRLNNPEAFYLSLALVAAAVISLLYWRRLNLLARILLIAGLLTTILTFDSVYDFYTALPLHQYLWQIRFTSFTGPALLLGVTAALPAWRWRPMVGFALLLIALDFYPSLALAHTNPAPTEFVQVAASLSRTPGWRVAVADLSRLGSKPSYLLSELTNREQVYGWAYQGARTARLVAALNDSFERGFTGYTLDRLQMLGVDDVITLDGVGVAPDLKAALDRTGWARVQQTDDLTLYHRDGAPRATRIENAILGIGAGAYDAALLFPSIVAGWSPNVNDYAPEDLTNYATVYLSNFSWRDQAHAEQVLNQYARAGGRVVIDLQGVPQDQLARSPKFMQVYGEPVELRSAVTLADRSTTFLLTPFDSTYFPWHAYVPQGKVTPSLTFNYLEEQANGVAYRDEGRGQIWFLGINLPYHALLTHDPQAIKILENVFAAPAQVAPPRTSIPLENYHADASGYQFTYDLPQAGLVLLPFAQHDGTQVVLDGKPVTSHALDTLISFQAPAGPHQVAIIFQPTLIYYVGAAMSIAAIIGLGLLWAIARLQIRFRRRTRAQVGIALALAAFLMVHASASAATPIVIDGNFNDWNGQPCITDPQNDSSDPDADLSGLCWANNPGDSTMYWMISRYSPNSAAGVTYLIHVDTNNDGVYEQTVTITYHANNPQAMITVDHNGTGAGETMSAGGRRVEVGVPFSALGIAPGQVIRFYVESVTSNQVRDTTSSVQVSAVDILDMPMLAGATICLIIGIWWLGRKKWNSLSS